jgi:hypothetical protein
MQQNIPSTLLEVLESDRLVYVNTKALASYVRSIEKQVLFRAQTLAALGGSSDPYNISNHASGMIDAARHTTDLAPARAFLNVLESSEQYKTAVAIIQPLLDAREAKEAAEIAEREKLVREIAAQQERIAEAEGRARKSLERDPAYIAAQHKLAELNGVEPEKPGLLAKLFGG